MRYHVVAEVNNPEEYAAAVRDNPCYRRTSRAKLLEPRGVEVLVYKPRALLAGALDVFRWQEA